MLDHPVSKYMTSIPMRIEESSSVAKALEIMKKTDIRHLPVVKNGKLVGILTSRDIVRQICSGKLKLEGTQVGTIMTAHPYTVSPDTPISEVSGVMASEKYGSALVVDKDHLVGIFTVIDALRVLHGATISNT